MERATWLLGSETSRESWLLSHQAASDLWTGQCFWGPAATFPQKLRAEVNQRWHKTAAAPVLAQGAELYGTLNVTVTVNEGLCRVTYSELHC